ncbi:MAG: protein-methionine-sulfoxide reductase catalytic subunit MsrP [Magnetovibrio sp.]|nr:protein-methionine-sulfoxide reductase catalytic subunit MsrP [Magnetovibrio sp.]
MLIKTPKSWALKECDTTPEAVFKQRRHFLKTGAAALAGGLAGGLIGHHAFAAWPKAGEMLANIQKSGFDPGEATTPLKEVSSYNNFYEFGTGKDEPMSQAKDFKTDPWTVEIAGACAKPGRYDFEDLVSPHQLEERIYRHRCVETWSMVVPWVGVPLADVIKRLEPTSKARYVAFETLHDPARMPGQNRAVLQWPYVEGLRMDEALNPLTLLTVGLYGQALPPQNGAPLRLVVPWKYGFKGIKSIVKITFTEDQPPTSWNRSAPHEYGFYANVNPEVSHPRWSQAKERRIGEFFKQDTLPFNGYGEEVEDLYTSMDLHKYF